VPYPWPNSSTFVASTVPSYDDRAWALVDLSHDYVVEGAYNQWVSSD
jgi:hypothetical protein